MPTPRKAIRTVLAALTASLTVALARQNNNSIDDTLGDYWTGEKPQYTTVTGSSWAPHNATPCPTCLIQPDPSQLLNGTWHEATSNIGQDPVNVSFSFTGVSLFVFCILANVVQGATTDTHLTFYIDNQPVGSFNHTPQSSSPTYEYNQMVYSNSSLDNTAHTFVMSNMGGYQYGQLGSLAMFDYAIYTRSTDLSSNSAESQTSTSIPSIDSGNTTTTSASESPPATSSPAAQTSTRGTMQRVLIGVSVALATILAGVLTCLVCCYRRRRRQGGLGRAEGVPFPSQGPQSTARRSRKVSAMFKHGLSWSDEPDAPRSIPGTSHVPPSGVVSDSSDVQEELAFLREEVERLRAVNEGPPPTYDSRSSTHSKP